MLGLSRVNVAGRDYQETPEGLMHTVGHCPPSCEEIFESGAAMSEMSEACTISDCSALGSSVGSSKTWTGACSELPGPQFLSAHEENARFAQGQQNGKRKRGEPAI